MLKYRGSFIRVGIYIIFTSIFLLFFPQNSLNIHVVYSDVYIFLLVLILYGTLIFDEKGNSCLELNRFRTLVAYLKWKIKTFIPELVVLVLGISLSNALILMVRQVSVNLFEWLYYTAGLLSLLMVLSLFVISNIQTNNYEKYGYYYIGILLLLFLLTILNAFQSFIPFNPIDYYLVPARKEMPIIESLLVFLGYIILALIKIKKEGKSVER